MIRKSFQKGHVTARRTRHGMVYDIRYRVRKLEGGWKQRCETLDALGEGKSGRAKAEEILQARLKEANPATGLVAPTHVTLQEMVDTHWQHYLDRKRVKPSTRSSYGAYLNKHILPAMGNFELAEIAPIHIGELLARKRNEGLSAHSAHHLCQLLETIFRVAVDNDLVQRSPVRRSHRPDFPKPQKLAWTPEQVRLIIAQIPTAYKALVITVAVLGIRLGEILALLWKHIDFDQREITIIQSVWRGQVQTTKTETVRVIPMGDFLLTTLARHRQHSMHRNPDDFVFCHSDGRGLDPDVLREDVLYPALKRAGLPVVKRSSGWHAFRHTVSTLVYGQTRDLKAARMYLGHADEKTTELYTHVTKVAPEPGQALEQVLFGDLLQSVTKPGSDEASVRPN